MKNEDEKINIKDIHKTFWECRNFELSHLWQRSIFLTTFLVVCFTAYGNILMKLFCISSDIKFIMFNAIAYILSLMGITFSILWIKMGKGSKAWYEIYENAIAAFEQNTKYATNKASTIGGFGFHKRLESYEKGKIANNILSTDGGAYSVSRINIAIGQVFLFIWSIIGISHFFVMLLKLVCIYNTSNVWCINNCHLLYIIFLSIGLTFVTIFTIIFNFSDKLKSGFLNNNTK